MFAPRFSRGMLFGGDVLFMKTRWLKTTPLPPRSVSRSVDPPDRVESKPLFDRCDGAPGYARGYPPLGYPEYPGGIRPSFGPGPVLTLSTGQVKHPLTAGWLLFPGFEGSGSEDHQFIISSAPNAQRPG